MFPQGWDDSALRFRNIILRNRQLISYGLCFEARRSLQEPSDGTRSAKAAARSRARIFVIAGRVAGAM
jgi:hypothetical protein